MSESIIFFVVVAVAVVFNLIVALQTKGIVSECEGSDANKQLVAAAHWRQWRWISDMHHYALGKAWLKDVGVLGLIAVQRLLGDRTSFYPIVVLCLIANAVTAILLYSLGALYFGVGVGFFLFFLFIGSLWPYQVVIQGGYQILSSGFFLASLLFLSQASASAPGSALLFDLVAGSAAGFMMFSSASARKFLPLLLIAFLVSQRAHFLPLALLQRGWSVFLIGYGGTLRWLVGSVVAVLFARFFVVDFLYPFVVRVRYTGIVPGWIRIFLKAGQENAYYKQREGRVIRSLTKTIAAVIIYAVVCLALTRSFAFYAAQFLFLSGVAATFVFFMAPRLLTNLKGFYAYWTINNFGGRFLLYVDLFKKIGYPISPDQCGVGFRWYPPFFWRQIPFHFLLYVLSVTFLIVSSLHPFRPVLFTETVLAIVVSITPILYAQYSRAIQASRSHFPSLFAFLWLIGYAVFRLEYLLGDDERGILFLLLFGFATVSAAWNAWFFFTDVLPARMAATELMKQLHVHGITKFFTYNTRYNDSFVEAIPAQERSQYTITYIESLRDVEEGYMVVPATTAKSVIMESSAYAIAHGDFRSDPLLNQLLDSHDIERVAIARIKTVGVSPFWAQESEATTFRDLILHEISAEDRWRGYAWILDAKKIHALYGTSGEI